MEIVKKIQIFLKKLELEEAFSDDNNNEGKLFEQLARRRNRKKRELNYLRVDDVDINITNGNMPTFKFKIEVNLSSLADFKPRFENVEIAGK